MSTYTTAANTNTYLGVADVTEAEVLTAETDIDDLALGAYERSQEAPFRKLDPVKISASQEDALARATAEQVRYRRLMGAEHFSKPQRTKGSVDGVSYEGTLPHIGPRVLAILADAGLVNKLGKSSTSPASDLEEIGWHLP